MKRKMCVAIVVLALLTGCASSESLTAKPETSIDNIPVYDKNVENISVPESFNPYYVKVYKDEIFYMCQEEKGEEGGDEYHSDFSFYVKKADAKEPVLLTDQISDVYVKDIGIMPEGENVYYVLWLDEKAHLTGYDIQGKIIQNLELSDTFNNLQAFPKLLPLSNGEFAVEMDRKIYNLSKDGEIRGAVASDGYVFKLLEDDSGKVFAVCEESGNGKTVTKLYEIDFKSKSLRNGREVPEFSSDFYCYEDSSFLALSGDCIYKFDYETENEEKIVNLDAQSILFSEVASVQKKGSGFSIVSFDKTNISGGMNVFTLSLKDGSVVTENVSKDFSADGRKIVRVAIPGYYPYQFDYYVKKYNQTSGEYYVETEVYDDTVENYLGKQNSADIVMLQSHTEIKNLVAKKALADLDGLFSKQSSYDAEDIISKAKEALSIDGTLYAMSDGLMLTLIASDKTEEDSDGKCTASDYLDWYDEFLSDNKIAGCSDLSWLAFSCMLSFYGNGEANFDSPQFAEFMEKMKEFLKKHNGTLDGNLYQDTNPVKYEIAMGASAYSSWNSPVLFEEGCCFKGLPSYTGEEMVFISVPFPLCVTEKSKVKEGAFDFLMYFCQNSERIYPGENLQRGESMLSDAGLSVFESALKEKVFETEKPVIAQKNGDGMELMYLSDANKNMLRDLLDAAIPETEEHMVIYEIFMEEAEGYLYGNKNPDEMLAALQSRAALYLAEQN